MIQAVLVVKEVQVLVVRQVMKIQVLDVLVAGILLGKGAEIVNLAPAVSVHLGLVALDLHLVDLARTMQDLLVVLVLVVLVGLETSAVLVDPVASGISVVQVVVQDLVTEILKTLAYLVTWMRIRELGKDSSELNW